jgi:hypothetical protein
MSELPAQSPTDTRLPNWAAPLKYGWWKQWSKVLLPAAVFLMELTVTYAYVPRACDAHRTPVLHWVLLAALATVCVTGVLAWRDYAGLGKRLPHDHGTPEERARFLALLGVLTSGLFALAMVAQGVAQVSVSPCVI